MVHLKIAYPSVEAETTSHERAVKRFDAIQCASQYPSEYRQSFGDRRERQCILKALKGVPAGSKVLDLPCGTGRLTRLLVERGYRVTGADSSPNMAALAAGNWKQRQAASSQALPDVSFEVRDALKTGYADDQFDAVVCNRLFHHFTEPETRVVGLVELSRICAGPLIVSFFNSFAFDSARFFFRHWRRGTVPNDRIPIPLQKFTGEAAEAGLTAKATFARIWAISPLWYVVFEKKAVTHSLDDLAKPSDTDSIAFAA